MLKIDYVPGVVSTTKYDNIVYGDGGWSHPECSPEAKKVAEGFVTTHPVSKKK